MSQGDGGGERSGREKRRIYIAAFIIALAIDFIVSLSRGMPYQPSLIGLPCCILAGPGCATANRRPAVPDYSSRMARNELNTMAVARRGCGAPQPVLRENSHECTC
jgi:hypothetical protein